MVKRKNFRHYTGAIVALTLANAVLAPQLEEEQRTKNIQRFERERRLSGRFGIGLATVNPKDLEEAS